MSADGGRSWRCAASLCPEPGLLDNNPRSVERTGGGILPDALVLYGWQGPGGVWSVPGCDTEDRNRGRAWLRPDGRRA